MPRKYKRKRQYRKRAYRKKRKPRQVALLSPVNGTGLAEHAIIKFRWAQYNNIQHATNPYAEHAYRLNSIYDPDLTGTGFQPPHHDDLATIYDRYKVIQCYAKITLHNHTADIPVVVSVSRTTDSVTGVVSTYAARIPTKGPNSIVRTLSAYNSGNDKNTTTIYMKTSLRKLMKSLYSDQNSQAAFNNNPPSSAFLNITAQSLDSTTPVQVRANVEFIYTTMLYQRDVIGATSMD